MKTVGSSDKGKLRVRNEDAYRFGYFDDGSAWGVVCDGMGGVHGGQLASNIAINMVSDKIKLCYTQSMPVTSLENLLLSAITTANVTVFDRGIYDNSLKGMGTTIVATIIKNSTACIAHVGDSRAYKISEESIEQITRDHSLVQEMLDKGQITKEEFENNPIKNIITRAMGVGEEIDVEFDFVELKKDEAILMCSDGLSGMINEEKIHEIYKTTEFDKLTEKYIQAANDNGGLDNITVVVMKG